MFAEILANPVARQMIGNLVGVGMGVLGILGGASCSVLFLLGLTDMVSFSVAWMVALALFAPIGALAGFENCHHHLHHIDSGFDQIDQNRNYRSYPD